MKYRLKNQIALIFIGTVLISLLAIGIINIFFLENYYVSKKCEALKAMYQKLTNFEGWDTDNDAVNAELVNISSEKNLTWVVTTSLNSVIDGYGRKSDCNKLAGQLFGYQTGLDINTTEVLVSRDNYSIQKCKDHFTGSDYLEMWGTLDDGNSFLIRSPLDSIRESAAISNKFFIYVGLLTIILSALIILFIANRLMKPISELTSISQRMTQLDFGTKYNSRRRNEIDVLGENFNSMSDQLEKTITALQSANLELEKDIADKIKIDEMRKDFLNNVSHELKTPIALIQGYAEGLKDNINDDPESMEFYCDVIIDESAKMNVMVKQLLNLNQLESGHDSVSIEHFNLVELIRGVIQKSDLLVKQHNASVLFDCQEEIYVYADEFKIEEVVTNFFTNALNHLDDRKTVEIKVSRQNKTAHVSVFNTGQPIPTEDIENIWNKFYRVDKAHTREYGGSGIGLSIVKAIMDSHHQKYGVRNYDNGVEFWFELNCD